MNKQPQVICSARLEKTPLLKCENKRCAHSILHDEIPVCNATCTFCSYVTYHVSCIIPTEEQKIAIMLGEL